MAPHAKGYCCWELDVTYDGATYSGRTAMMMAGFGTERKLNKIVRTRTVCYGDGQHQPRWTMRKVYSLRAEQYVRKAIKQFN